MTVSGGPVPAGFRVRPPKRRSSAGPLVFVLAASLLVVGGVIYLRPLVVAAFVDFAAERDGLLRQPFVRALVAPRVGSQPDLAADPAAQPRDFVVRQGETASGIASRLEAEGFIKSTLAFRFVLFESGQEYALQAGTYRISAAMTPREIARVFEVAPSEQAALRIIEGWRLSETAVAVNKAFPAVTKEAFVAAAVVGQRKDSVLAGLDPKTPLEGFLFPETYLFRTDATAGQIVDTLLATLEQRVGAALRAAAAERQTTVYDLVKLASLVEREARDRSESPTIAGVYANRLRIGMKLDADPTIQYALGDWRTLMVEDLSVQSPYNTYLVAGLPPTPICSAGQAALEAAAEPAKHDYLFFVAKTDGTGQHLFAKTLEEHEANRVRIGNR